MRQSLLVLNTSVLIESGTYRYELVSVPEARAMVAGALSVISAVRHPAARAVVERDLDVSLRDHVATLTHHRVGQLALVFKLRGRQPLGRELDVVEIDRVGYDFHALARLA